MAKVTGPDSRTIRGVTGAVRREPERGRAGAQVKEKRPETIGQRDDQVLGIAHLVASHEVPVPSVTADRFARTHLPW